MSDTRALGGPRPRLYAWPPDADPDRLGVIDQDVRDLLRELAAARQALGEQQRAHHAAVRRELLALLEVTDAFDRILRGAQTKEEALTKQMKRWLGNFRAIRRLLGNVLADAGVVALESLTSEFDPHTHSAADTVADSSQPDGLIVEERQRGYVWHDEILRKAEVVVVRNDGPDEDAEAILDTDTSDRQRM
jgi:molecular chaperone GrpE (heat shock protein)